MSEQLERKKESKEQLLQLIKESPIIGVANLENLPSAQLNKMRKKLRKDMKIYMTKKTIVKKAIEETKTTKKGIEQLAQQLKGMPALFFTKENPFKISKTIRQNKSKAPAKPGQTATSDVIIKSGPTQFPPGPIISDLGSVGLKTGVENGKVVIKEDKTILKVGETFTERETNVLGKLGMEPMEIGLEIEAVLEEGTIYNKEVLSIDDREYINQMKRAITEGTNLSVFINYPTKQNIKTLITKAFINSKHISELSETKQEQKETGENKSPEKSEEDSRQKEERNEQPSQEEKASEQTKAEENQNTKEEKKEE